LAGVTAGWYVTTRSFITKITCITFSSISNSRCITIGGGARHLALAVPGLFFGAGNKNK